MSPEVCFGELRRNAPLSLVSFLKFLLWCQPFHLARWGALFLIAVPLRSQAIAVS